MTVRSLLRTFKRAFFAQEPLITVSISKECLLGNFRAYKAAYPAHKIAPVFKSNAYGHGLALVAEILDREGVAFFMVDSLFEAKVLRGAGIRSRVTVMGYVRPEQIAHSKLRDTDYALTDLEQLRDLSMLARRPVRVHLKLDTGMHRQGILPDQLEEAIGLLRKNTNLRIVGVATHLADADNPDTARTEKQLALWDVMLARLEEAFPAIEYRHAAATKGAAVGALHRTDTLRLGMGLYGFDTSAGSALRLRPVLAMRSFVASIRPVPAGETVGYSATFIATRPSLIATVPAGYYEGVDRGLSNRGTVMVGGHPAPIAGRVSMNMVSLDVTDVPYVARGDLVTLISRNPEDPNAVPTLTKDAGITPYVLLAHIPAHLYRVVE